MPGVEIPMPHVPGLRRDRRGRRLGPGVDSVSVGRPVLLEPGFTDADGPEVEAGLDHLAPDYQIRGEHGAGFAAEFVCLPARYLTPLPEGVDIVGPRRSRWSS